MVLLFKSAFLDTMVCTFKKVWSFKSFFLIYRFMHIFLYLQFIVEGSVIWCIEFLALMELDITNQGNAYQNNNEILPHTCQNG